MGSRGQAAEQLIDRAGRHARELAAYFEAHLFSHEYGILLLHAHAIGRPEPTTPEAEHQRPGLQILGIRGDAGAGKHPAEIAAVEEHQLVSQAREAEAPHEGHELTQ